MVYSELTEQEQLTLSSDRKKRLEQQHFVDSLDKAIYEKILETEGEGVFKDKIQSYLDGANSRLSETEKELNATNEVE